MKTKSLILTAFFATLTLLLASCDDKPSANAVPPTFSEMTIEPKAPHAGDSITVTVGFANKGKHWYKTKYSWTLSGPNKEHNAKGYGVVMSDEGNPKFKLKLPEEAGSYTLKFIPGYASASTLFPMGSDGVLTTTTSIEKGSITFAATNK